MVDSLSGEMLSQLLRQFLADKQAAGLRSLAHYQAQFPSFESCVAAEYHLLSRAGRSFSSSPGSDASGGEPSRLDTVGDSYGRYRTTKLLGSGGQGVVYLAEDTELRRPVALKVLRWSGAGVGVALKRFRREAEITSSIVHPAICPVYDVGVSPQPYIAMRFVEGETLTNRIYTAGASAPPDGTWESETDRTSAHGDRRPPMIEAREIAEFLRCIELVARALDAAHESGVVHRDIKPGNIMVGADGPIILDFGLASATASEGTLTHEGDRMGTPAYMSPEQTSSAFVDRRTDVWSLGVTLYEGLTRSRPFDGPSRKALDDAINEQDPECLRRKNSAVSRDLSKVVLKCLEKEPDRRYATARELGEELRRVRHGEPVLARPVTRWARFARWSRRNPALAASGFVAVLSLSAGLIMSLWMLGERTQALVREQDAVADRTLALVMHRQSADPAVVRGLMREAEALWPRRPERVHKYESWLKRARLALSRIPGHMKELAALRERAEPPRDDDRELEVRQRRKRYRSLYEAIHDAETRVLKSQRALAKRPSAAARASLASANRALADLRADPRCSERQVWRFADREDGQLHQSLFDLEQTHGDFTELIADVEKHMMFARDIRRVSIEQERAAWEVCRKDLASSKTYRNLEIPAQIGLVPLGKDKDSGYWEFWHVGSGARPRWEGTALGLGKAKIDSASGLVLVLLPSGKAWMGSQSSDKAKPNFDTLSRTDEQPPDRVEISPLFMGKHEVMQAQWARLMGHRPSFYQHETVTLRHPVERVSWHDARTFLARLGLVLPTEAQWEYAARAGTTGPWWPGPDKSSLNGVVNLADTAGRARGLTVYDPSLTDSYDVHGPVGSLPPNKYGLHEVLGNVMEWCRDGNYDYFDRVAGPGDGFRGTESARTRVIRGGAFDSMPDACRTASRFRNSPGYRSPSLGCRASMRIMR